MVCFFVVLANGDKERRQREERRDTECENRKTNNDDQNGRENHNGTFKYIKYVNTHLVVADWRREAHTTLYILFKMRIGLKVSNKTQI